MQWVEVHRQKRFAPEKFQKVNLFDSPRMFCDLYCFEPGQEQKLHLHAHSDKIYYVLEGEGLFRIGEEEKVLSAGMATMAPPGVEHGVRNTGRERLTLLVFMAPKP
ncbi:MAG: cupin domain-containing protein [Nitrospinota bacterium]|nr:MAG: cupin domain-containing protein [Nitrospinota bacterium]